MKAVIINWFPALGCELDGTVIQDHGVVFVIDSNVPLYEVKATVYTSIEQARIAANLVTGDGKRYVLDLTKGRKKRSRT